MKRNYLIIYQGRILQRCHYYQTAMSICKGLKGYWQLYQGDQLIDEA